MSSALGPLVLGLALDRGVSFDTVILACAAGAVASIAITWVAGLRSAGETSLPPDKKGLRKPRLPLKSPPQN